MLDVKETENEVLRDVMNEFKESMPCGQRRKISSIYRSQSRGLRGWEERKDCSKRPRKRLA